MLIEFIENNGKRIVRFDHCIKRFYVYRSSYSREVGMVVPLAEDAKYKDRAMAQGFKHKDMYRYIRTEKPKTEEVKEAKIEENKEVIREETKDNTEEGKPEQKS